MTDSKFCEHGVNVGLKNPPVFCGQCPPDTITKLRGEIVILHSANARGASMVNEINVARAAFARRLGDALGISEDDSIIAAIEKLRADLAKMTPSPEVRAAIIACADVAAAAMHRTSGNPYTGLVFDWLAALPPDAEKPVPCPDCADGAYPHYGGAPGSDFAGPTDADIVVTDRFGVEHHTPKGAFIFARRDPAPRETWPSNFREDPDCPGLGTWFCPSCGGKETA